MGMFDKFKDAAEKAVDMAGQHTDKLDPLIEKAGDTIDEKTGKKFSGQVDAAQEAAKKALHEKSGGEKSGE